MSDKNPQPKDRTALYIAIVGATATIFAAMIGVLPNLLNRDVPPTPIVITVTPQPTTQAQAPVVPPTNTVAPTATSLPTNTLAPSATVLAPTQTISPTLQIIEAGATPPRVSPTPSNITSLVLVNNLPRVMDFYIDGVAATSIDGGSYQVLPIPIGAHEFKQCVSGSDTTNPDNCLARTTILTSPIDYWEMFEALTAGDLQTTLTLLVLNQASTPQDIYMDGIFARTVGPNAFIALTGPGGLHTLQPCPLGETPASGSCGERYPLQLGKRIEIFKILGESP